MDKREILVNLTTFYIFFSLFAQNFLKMANEKKRAFARKREILRALKF